MLLLGSSAALTVCAVVLLSPLVALVFGVALLPFSWPFLGMLPVLVLFALLLSHGSAASWWWRTLPPLRAATWLADRVHGAVGRGPGDQPAAGRATRCPWLAWPEWSTRGPGTA